MLSEAASSVPVEAEVPLRLLRHYASSIRATRSIMISIF